MSKQNITIGGVIVALVLSILGLFGGSNQTAPVPVPDLNFGRVGTQMPNGVTIGSSGTNNRHVIDTTCALAGADIVQTASTTKGYGCAVTGVTSSFNVVLAQLSTSTPFIPAQGQGFVIVGAKASSTAGQIDVLVFNAAGTATAPSILGYASSTSIHAVQTQ